MCISNAQCYSQPDSEDYMINDSICETTPQLSGVQDDFKGHLGGAALLCGLNAVMVL
jgi:hypothetical protein